MGDEKYQLRVIRDNRIAYYRIEDIINLIRIISQRGGNLLNLLKILDIEDKGEKKG